jgi:hypothetical protein
MTRPACEQKETLEANARNAVAYEKKQENTLPDPEERKDAVESVELASVNLRDHLENCAVCRHPS